MILQFEWRYRPVLRYRQTHETPHRQKLCGVGCRHRRWRVPSNPPFRRDIGSLRYHLLLGTGAIFIFGPLGGISAAFMNSSIGFFIGGQVLAGILGSTVALPYGPEGKHGAKYMRTSYGLLKTVL